MKNHRRSILIAIAISGSTFLCLVTPVVAQQHYIVDADQTTTFGGPVPVLAAGDSVTVLEGVSIAVTDGGGILFENVGSNKILNLGTVTATGFGARAIQLRGSPNSSITNVGTVISATRALYAFDSANTTITNLGQVTTTHGGHALFLFSAPNSMLINHGTIRTNTSNNIGMYAFDTLNAQLVNTGAIQTGGVEFSDGMVARDFAGASLHQ